MSDPAIRTVIAFITAPMLTNMATGSSEVIVAMNASEMIINTINLLVTAIVTISVQLGIAYIQAKVKKAK